MSHFSTDNQKMGPPDKIVKLWAKNFSLNEKKIAGPESQQNLLPDTKNRMSVS